MIGCCLPGAYRSVKADTVREKLTPTFVKTAKPPEKGDRTVYWDTAMPSFGLMVTESGTRSFVYQYRNTRQESRRKTWAARLDGSSTGLTLDQARKEARKLAGDVERGKDPVAEHRKAKLIATTTLKAICEEYLTREGGMTRDNGGKPTFNGKLRSAEQRLKIFERLVYPEKISGQQIDEIKRSEIVKLLDKVEDERGPRMAHVVLAYLSKVFNWYASRNDDFRSPIVRGMGRVKPRERAGKRVLTDEELRDVWTALDSGAEDIPSCFPRFLRTLLLTAVRRDEAARAAWQEIEHIGRDDYEGDVWTVPGSRMKSKLDHAVPLTSAVLTVIGKRPKNAKVWPFVFSTTGGERPFSGYSKAKAALDGEIAKLRKSEGRDPMPPWTLSRDVRRTAKTLMARAGVRPDISERVLSHVIPGVEGIYDRYEYLAEKQDALTKLAALIDRIVNAPAANVAA
jgi:integrase